ncbi:SDR family NAD(P)-dependent oxidoreductase [Pendulispora rubella]|uniref:SDR family NAD(P)-dependent oxidoreductase n=1 Tax=Pendulispora rubella TaxID=2741070 RepID=A0ABZ2KTI0_9BACT
MGGSRGVGLSTALLLGQRGWDVTIAARDAGRLESVCEKARANGIRLHGVVADVTSESSVQALFRTMALGGPLDLCVNSAGENLSRRLVRTTKTGSVETHALTDWERTINLCLTGVFLCGREAAAAMLTQRSPGVIVNISSAVYEGAFGQSAYAAAKAAVVSLTRSWALELAEHGVRVVAVAPGVIDGQALRDKCEKHSSHALYMEILRDHVPLRRWATELEIAEAVFFAATHAYVTGTVLEIHGGGVPARVHTTNKGLR